MYRSRSIEETGLSKRGEADDAPFIDEGDPTTGSLLIVQSPGGVIEKYLEKAWEKIENPSNPPPPAEPDFERVVAAAHKYGIEVLPPA